MKKLGLILIIIAIVAIALIYILNNQGNKENIDKEITVRLDGSKLEMPIEPLKIGSYFFIPVEPVLNKLKLSFVNEEDELIIHINDNIILREKSILDIDGSNPVDLDKIFIKQDENILISISHISSKLDLRYDYNPKTNIISLQINNDLLIPYEEALNILVEDKIATITDIETLITYKVKRVVGGYATIADVEPLTKDDTNKLLQTAGGNWNITRRAVIVNVDGINIAASIVMWPHSGREDAPFGNFVDNRSGGTRSGINLDSIRDNNMIGVVDIYFYNSLIPGIRKIDEWHQEKVLEASRSNIQK